MPGRETLQRVAADKRQGKSAGTQAGEFIREEMDHIREGKHGARSAKQAIAIGLSKARRAGVDLPAPKRGTVSEDTRGQAARDSDRGRSRKRSVSATRSRATTDALKREGTAAASHLALSRHSHAVARTRSPEDRAASARKAAASRTPAERSTSARKAAQTRARNAGSGSAGSRSTRG